MMRRAEQELLCLQRLAVICADDSEYMSASDREMLNIMIARKLWDAQDTWNEGRQLPPLGIKVEVIKFEDHCSMYDRVRCFKSELNKRVEVPTTVYIRRLLADSYAPEFIQLNHADDENLVSVLKTSDFMWRTV